jgi:hypothetical protein
LLGDDLLLEAGVLLLQLSQMLHGLASLHATVAASPAVKRRLSSTLMSSVRSARPKLPRRFGLCIAEFAYQRYHLRLTAGAQSLVELLDGRVVAPRHRKAPKPPSLALTRHVISCNLRPACPSRG